MSLELPHTRGCVVCGHDNPQGIHLQLKVDESTGLVTAAFTPAQNHMGFQGIVHGGLLSTVLDEAMVWAATWAGKRFCVCGEMNVRFRHSVIIGQPVRVEARIASARSRLIETEGFLRDAAGKVLVESTGKYVPVSAERNRDVIATFVAEPATDPARQRLTDAC
ncbi:MAG TPA: PaaI family thioesterase [Tepidisphaeraceae bacterium]